MYWIMPYRWGVDTVRDVISSTFRNEQCQCGTAGEGDTHLTGSGWDNEHSIDRLLQALPVCGEIY